MHRAELSRDFSFCTRLLWTSKIDVPGLKPSNSCGQATCLSETSHFLGKKNKAVSSSWWLMRNVAIYVNQQLPRKIDKHHRCLEDHGEEGSQVESHKNISQRNLEAFGNIFRPHLMVFLYFKDSCWLKLVSRRVSVQAMYQFSQRTCLGQYLGLTQRTAGTAIVDRSWLACFQEVQQKFNQGNTWRHKGTLSKM